MAYDVEHQIDFKSSFAKFDAYQSFPLYNYDIQCNPFILPIAKSSGQGMYLWAPRSGQPPAGERGRDEA